MDILLWLFVSFLLIVVASLTTVFLVVRAVVRRARRSRLLSGNALRVRARLASGPQGRVLRLRVRLADALSSGRAAVQVSASGDGPRGEFDRLFARIEHEGEALDRQLHLMESEADRGVLDRELPAASQRVDQVAGMVREMRAAVASGLGGLSDDELRRLRADVDREATALHAGVEHLRALNRDGSWSGSDAVRRTA
ncbi:hypothetical protein GCM10009819_22600 [Agromyces tropicus]|uniref:DUF2746 domain-containing protein n=1 Tax=Agromyces tropicus TaxID=555371 RepID=A0ABP5FZQ2_9MICO